MAFVVLAVVFFLILTLDMFIYCALLLFLMCLLILENQERKGAKRERERHQWVASHTHPDQGLSPKPTYVP